MQISNRLSMLNVAVIRDGQQAYFSLGLDTCAQETFVYDSRFGTWWAGTSKADHRRVDVSYVARQVKAAADAR